ncbi:uncharacterized protein LOC108742546 [Agrilus planipennis]|uniref:XK-related protein n=1 Tax=Agrilus planipennis TaxID=224129 RepID=A0A7F5RAU2_AGRPL|nr:uncharacterized protein LOC108742546 [Agrilus planipennis]
MTTEDSAGVKKSTALGQILTTKQNIYANYLIPSVAAVLLYNINFACDVVVAYRHYAEDNPVWASLTIFFLYLPIIGCFVLTVSAWEHWPEFEGCGVENVKWIFVKIFQHVFFPLWAMWRFAEKIFWSIEGVRTDDKELQNESLQKLSEPRTIELYFFLQGYLQAAPQVLLQLHILMRNVSTMDKDTIDAQVLCIAMSLARMSVVTTLYQHFKSQKMAGRNYPWFKDYKFTYDIAIEGIHIRNRDALITANERPRNPERRRSSEFYEVPTGSTQDVRTRTKNGDEEPRETSVVDGPKRTVFRDAALAQDDDYFNPRRLRKVEGLPEDDVVGKIIGFMWWFCFLISRMLTIASFGYFYPSEIVWILSAHFIITVSILLYDVRADEVRRSKAIFFIFLGFVYLFCLIEFKIRFKKAKFIFFGFFTLMFLENFSMNLVWWNRDMEDIINDFWFRFIFYMIVLTTIMSFSSMVLYIFIFKPKKVVVKVIAERIS